MEGSFYHLYNRGVEKKEVFRDSQDFSVFLSFLKNYLIPKDVEQLRSVLNSPTSSCREKDKAQKQLLLKNFYDQIDLVAYSLLPNHFHLLVRQTGADNIDRFMNALGVRYSGYFNRKYQRVGPLYQGVYKAVLVETDEQLLYLTKYIHRNPLEWRNIDSLEWQGALYPFSLPEYLGKRRTEWLKSKYVLNYFSTKSPQLSYLAFMSDEESVGPIGNLLIDVD